MSHTSRISHTMHRTARARQALWIGGIAAGVLLAALLLLTACGAGNIAVPSRTPHPGSGSTATVNGSSPAYAYLYSRIDYPLEVAVNAGNTVTLTLSPQQNLLFATPGIGSGVTTAAEPIPLPTSLSDYNDIGASVDTESLGDSPIVWQPISPPRQSLLTLGAPGITRAYLDNVSFQWHVQAVAPGQNLVRIVLHLYYIYLDGSEHDGMIQMSANPTPIVAVQAAITSTSLPDWFPTWLTTALSQWRMPLAGLSGLAGLLGVLRFVWDLIQNARDARDTAESAARAAAAVHARVTHRR